MTAIGSLPTDKPATPAWTTVREQLHARGLRWTPQRRTLIDVLSRTDGHVTGAELVERCREVDPATTPSTVYRTLDVLEGLGLVSHSHGVDGREEFHVLPPVIHGHLHCIGCGQAWDIPLDEAGPLVDSIRRSRGFEVDVTHLSIAGRCTSCADQARSGSPG
jgi:Fur family ferric uptake transcriptional regulator